MKTGIVTFFAGILVLYQLPVLPDSRWVILLIPLLVLLVLKPGLRVFICFLCGFLWALYRADIVLDQQIPQTLVGKDLTVQGTVVDLSHQSSRRQQFMFMVDSIDGRVSDQFTSCRFKLNWYDDYPQLEPGERWQLIVRVKHPRGFMNPGGGDYEASLFQKRINATGYVRQGQKLEQGSISVLQRINRWRSEVYHDLKTSFPDQNGIIPALGLGIRDDLSQDVWKVLTSTGTIHLTAISGLHIGLVAGLAFLAGRWLWSIPAIVFHSIPATKMGAMFAIITAVFYAAMAGFSIPTQRALVMVLTIMFCLISNRQISRVEIFLIALLSVLLFSPVSVISAGFWLSFAAVAVIFYTTSGRTGTSGLWYQSLRIHFILALGLSPLLLMLFGQNPLLSPLANVFAVPFFGLLITPLVLIGILLLNIFRPCGVAILEIVDILIDRFWPFLEWISGLPYASLQVSMPSIGILIISLLGIIIFLMPRGLPGRWLAGFFILPIFLNQPPSPEYGDYELVLLDVGQGLSAVVRTNDHVLLYDTGARFSADFDTGKAVVLPYLKAAGIKRLDKVIISHGDNDHRGGYDSIAGEMLIGETLTSVPEKLQGKNIYLCNTGQRWDWGGVSFEILHPDQNYKGNGNNRSCVLKVDNGHQSVLLTGDIEEVAESDLITKIINKLGANIVVVPHHGSKTSSSAAFIDAVSPEYALFSAGYLNRYHHPAENIVERYQQAKIKLLNTANDGAIRFYIDKSLSIPDRYRLDHGHFWNRNHVK